MKWIVAKMQELGVTNNPNYKLTFMMDSLAMITVHSPKYGVINVSSNENVIPYLILKLPYCNDYFFLLSAESIK